MRHGLLRLVGAGVVIVAACTQDVSAPGFCPQFCPKDALSVVDTVLGTAISRDSSYGRPSGFVNPTSANALLAVNLPGVRDRAEGPMLSRFVLVIIR